MIPSELDTWGKSTQELAGRHPIVHAAHHHAWLERIHPFIDGNGRAGRLVLNFMLVQHGYPPAVILASQRRRYLQTLQTADEGNSNPLAEVVARAVHDTLNRFSHPEPGWRREAGSALGPRRGQPVHARVPSWPGAAGSAEGSTRRALVAQLACVARGVRRLA
jgi:hypothetical protein